ncbi:hypothetical protein L3X38_033602 [Prunus dulcis]|uniref:RNase H type-1 domain-containing protein n=1 Tax=Prunus dulcis TaxID=3755 RepID=A0AAD4VHN8_PRUDU|nr:hypothetical protein L3X38_033602 [Prunus dulcis]
MVWGPNPSGVFTIKSAYQLPCNAQSQEFDHLSKAILICWQIWEARNNLIFHSTQPHPTRCVHAAAVVGLDYWQQNHIVKPKASSPMAIKWHAPCWDGLALALNRWWRKIIVEGDSKLIIDSVLKKVSIPWSIQQIVQDIWRMSSLGDSTRFQHVLGRQFHCRFCS